MPLNINWQQILLHLLNLVILIVGLYLILYKPVKKFMKKRNVTYASRQSWWIIENWLFPWKILAIRRCPSEPTDIRLYPNERITALD